jgi:hypothetical protein
MELAMIWKHWACVMPDDGGAALDQMMAAMHHDSHWVTEPEVIGYIVKVTDPTALIYLRLAVDGARVLGTDELMIAVDDRPECERLLREQCPSHVEWSCLAHIATGTAGALARLRELHAPHSGPRVRGQAGGVGR